MLLIVESPVAMTIEDILCSIKTPGVQYIMADSQKVLYSQAYGFAQINKHPMTINTPQNIFSATKPLTALAILQLVDKGVVSLEDSLKRFFPGSTYGEKTIKQLLTHTASVPDPFFGNFFIHFEHQHQQFNRDLELDILIKNNPAKKQKKPQVAYSNLGFAMLGKIIEICSGLSYEDYIRIHIFEPCGILPDEAHFLFQNYPTDAMGYYKNWNPVNWFIAKVLFKGGDFTAFPQWNQIDNKFTLNFPAHGGLVTSSKAYIRIWQDLLCNTPSLLTQKSRDAFFSTQFRGNKVMAFSFFIDSTGNKKYLYHDGGGLGFVSRLIIYPTEKKVSLLMLNCSEPAQLNNLQTMDALQYNVP